MPRRRVVPKREILPDPLYNSQLVTKFINSVMSQGKKSVAEGILYGALNKVAEKTQDDPMKIFKKAIENVKPALEVKSRRVGGSTYQVPVEVRPNRRTSLAIRWIIEYATARGEKTMREKLAAELLDAVEPARRRDEEEGRHAQDGRGEQGVRPLPLVSPKLETSTTEDPHHAAHSLRSKTPATSGSWRTSTPARRRRPSGSSSTRASTTRSARCTRAPRPWTGWSRSRSAASRSRRPRRPASGKRRRRPRPHQHHRHAGPRRLHGRGRALAARARRRRRRVRRGRRRRAAVRDRLAPGQPLRRAAHRLRQQDGPRRRELPALRRDDEDEARTPSPRRSRSRGAPRASTAASSTSSR